MSSAITANFALYLPSGIFAAHAAEEQTSDTIYFAGNTYKLFDEGKSRDAAKAYCEELGGHLATITSAEEQSAVEELIANGTKSSYWLGATDEVTDGEWLWVTGEEFTYEKWANSQPDNDYSGREDYLGISRTNQGWANANEWNDFVIDFLASSGGFICEWDGKKEEKKVIDVSPYVLFSGSEKSDFTLNCWKSSFVGDIYTGNGFTSTSSELYVDGKINAAEDIALYGWKREITETNAQSEKETMPDWDARILKMAENCETADGNVILGATAKYP